MCRGHHTCRVTIVSSLHCTRWSVSTTKPIRFRVFGISARHKEAQIKALGVELVSEADESTTGPVSSMAIDKDGVPILVDQHV